MSEASGKVWLVGAGPGDAGLLTCKGLDTLRAADVVVYDSLVGDGVLALVPRNARTIDVGKRASNHTMRQEDISKVLLNEALAGNRVVRLKGGDPFLFGRGGEELELLEQHDVPYEVVPGVTSAIAVPAYNGIPVTHRDFTSSLHIITGHKREGADYDIDFNALVRTNGTLVFLMGVRSLPDIMEGLLAAGMAPDIPAAVLQEGTTAGQRHVVATVSTLEQAAREAGVAAPAIIVVGRVCALADKFAWHEKLPLHGCKVLVTRPAEVVSTMSRRLAALGAEVLDIPAIRTVPVEGSEELARALTALDTYEWVVFTSPSGVRIFFERMRAASVDIRKLGGTRIAALGTGTARELTERGIIADLVPEKATGADLGRALSEVTRPGCKVLIPRARIGNAALVRALDACEVDDIATYDTVPADESLVDVERKLNDGSIFCAAFTSSSGVRSFANAYPGVNFGSIRAACIGEVTAATAKELGMQTHCADRATMDSLADLIIELYNEQDTANGD